MSKQRILTFFQIIALVAAVAGAVSLLYNAIDMLTNTPFVKLEYSAGSGYEYLTAAEFKDGQKPLAIITLVASVFAFVGAGAGTASLFVKNKWRKTVCIALSVVAVVACLVLIIAASCVWSDFYKEYVSKEYASLKPHPIRGEVMSSLFAIYSSVMSMLIQQLVYTVIFTVPMSVNYILDLKSAKAQKILPAEIPAETEKENN
ncbi:MAG: hypothetical protein K2N22_00625 [Clostridia bacterium]|nr:hypothetical protein [Clostridia bacterium]